MGRVEVQPNILYWALERSHETEDSVKSKFPRIRDWLSGEGAPTLKQLEKFAAKTCTPLGYFFLVKPPVEKLPIPDFRTLKGQPKRPSPGLLDTVRTMQSRCEWMREFLIEEGQEPLSFIRSVTLQADPAGVAAEMRKTLGLSGGWAGTVSRWEDALRQLRKRIEEAGVMIVINGVVGNNTHRPLEVEEFRGFALVDEYAPLIFINGHDSKSAQMFTIVHELSHIWLGLEGVSNFDILRPSNASVELFCNRVAAEFLVPSVELERALKDRPGENNDDVFGNMARRFKVSPIVVGRRMLDMGYISREGFFRFYNDYAKELARQNRKTGRGDFWNTQIVRIGELFGSAIAQATLEGRLLYRDAYRLTGLKAKTFDNYIARLGF